MPSKHTHYFRRYKRWWFCAGCPERRLTARYAEGVK